MKTVAGLLLGLAVALGHATATASDGSPAGLSRDDWRGIRHSIATAGGPAYTHEAQVFGHADPPEPSPMVNDQFGYSISVSGDTLVVGAPFDDLPAGTVAGSAYVFVRAGTTWTLQAKLLASDAAQADFFGFSVAVSGDTVVVGAWGDDTPGGNAGSAYVYVRSGVNWTEQQKLLALDAAPGDAFGHAVSVSGDTVVVAARLDDTSGGGQAGSAYVFVRSGTTWTEQQRLQASDGALDDQFGYSVSISGDTLVVGSRFDDTAAGPEAGSAYVFVRSGTTWTEQQKLVTSDAAPNDQVGLAVSASGDTVIVSAHLDDTAAGPDAGSAYVFVRSGTTWTEQQKLVASDAAASTIFGTSVSVSGDRAVIGSPFYNQPGASIAGSAYVFARSGATWTEVQALAAPDAAAFDQFGFSVAVEGDTVAVGAMSDDVPAAEAGSVHVFREGPTAADTALSITDSPDPVRLGAHLAYTIVVTNNGPDAASGVQVSLPTPSGLTFVSNAGACTTPFPCALGTISSGQTRTITATYHVPLGYTGPNPIAATASATAATTDPSPGNNQATASTAVIPASADLQLVKAGPSTADVGTNIVYTLVIDNFGPSDAADVQVDDSTPPGLTFISNSGACTTPFPCALAVVPGGQVRIIIATFHIPAGYSGPNPIVNEASVSSSTADPVLTNNADSVSTTVNVPNLVPAAIAVDAAGNLVFQPNETVVVAPSWRNAAATAMANVAGAASAFTGPAGPAYTIVDPAATYGTIAPAATASCGADCYALGITAATRPVTHWDSTFMEAITPGTATKTWTLHIGDSFVDVPPGNGFYRFIETILHKNVTGGCTATAYCPSAPTTRDAMAVFVLVAREAPGYVPPACGATPMFPDVPVASGFCRWIEELARRGVVSGCGGGNYCPSSPATREQMAVFVLRTLDPALNPPACVAGSETFADVPAASGFCRWIEELARRGVVTGCGGGNYCPTAAVTREQMSVFLSVTFGLALYGL